MLLLGVLQLGVHIWLIPSHTSWPLFVLLFCHNFQSHLQFALGKLNKDKLINKTTKQGEVRNGCMTQNTDCRKKTRFGCNPTSTNKDQKEPRKSGFHIDPSPALNNVLIRYSRTSQTSLTPEFQQPTGGSSVECLNSNMPGLPELY